MIDTTNLAPGDIIDSTTIPTIIDVPTASVHSSIGSPMPVHQTLEKEDEPATIRQAHTTTVRGRKVCTLDDSLKQGHLQLL